MCDSVTCGVAGGVVEIGHIGICTGYVVMDSRPSRGTRLTSSCSMTHRRQLRRGCRSAVTTPTGPGQSPRPKQRPSGQRNTPSSFRMPRRIGPKRGGALGSDPCALAYYTVTQCDGVSASVRGCVRRRARCVHRCHYYLEVSLLRAFERQGKGHFGLPLSGVPSPRADHC